MCEDYYLDAMDDYDTWETNQVYEDLRLEREDQEAMERAEYLANLELLWEDLEFYSDVLREVLNNVYAQLRLMEFDERTAWLKDHKPFPRLTFP